MLDMILRELKTHAPFTAMGTVAGLILCLAFFYGGVDREISESLFETIHPLHVFFSAIVTTALFKLHSDRGLLWCLAVGYIGSVGIGTLSDCLIPYLGELLMARTDAHVHGEAHIGFIDLWWIVNPLAIGGTLMAYYKPRSYLPHAGHVLLSTSASLFHMLMAVQNGNEASLGTFITIPIFLFVAVWLPCCTSDILFPLLAAGKGGCEVASCPHHEHGHHH